MLLRERTVPSHLSSPLLVLFLTCCLVKKKHYSKGDTISLSFDLNAKSHLLRGVSIWQHESSGDGDTNR